MGVSLLGLATAAGVALGAVRIGTYEGTTSQTEPATIVIAHQVVGGVTRDIVQAKSSIAYTAACVGGGSLTPSPMHLSGVLHGDVFSLKNAQYRDSFAHGGEVLHTVTARFTVHGRLLTGSFVNRATVRQDGKVVHRCTTGEVTLRATRAASADASA